MMVTDAAAMQSVLGSEHLKSQDSSPSVACALWPVDLKLTHLDWNPEATLIHFQGQYLTICELDYDILHRELQNVKKTNSAVDIGEVCLVEDFSSGCWYRGRVQKRKKDLFDVFLIDHGNVLSADITHISSCSKDLFILPPKIVCGFLSNVLVLQGCSNSVVEDYFSSLIGRNATGYIQAFLPHKVLLLEVPDINQDLVRHGFGRLLDTDTFLLLVEMLTEVPLKQNVNSVPDLLIERPRGQEFSFKPPGLQRYKDILSFFRPRLSCGTHVKVRVTAAVSPGLFYCQMASVETDLREMSNRLATFCEHRTKECSQKAETENLGLLCSVKGKEGKWYRGFVQFLPVNSQVRVLFIDYGFFESVKIENVHRLPPDFFSAPIMVFPCSLSCLSGQDEAVRTQQLGFLKAALLGAVLDVEIRGCDEEQHLYSISVAGVEDQQVKEQEPIQEHPEMKVRSVFVTEEISPQGGYLYYETIMSKALDKTLEAEDLQADSAFVGYVEYVQNPNHFWIRTQKRNDEFEEMMAKIADHFSQVKLDEDVLLNPELGAMCCALYEEDMHFYRAVVTDTLDHGAEVLFVDFGNIEKVPHTLIKKIPEEFASKTAFAFCCSLVNVFPLDEVWTGAVSDFFRRAVSNKALLVRVVHKRKNKFVVDLYEMGSDSSQSITELLIASKQEECWNRSTASVVQNNADVSENARLPRYNVTPDIKSNAEQWEKEENTCRNETANFKALSINPGCEFAVRCLYANSPSDFWCQPLEKIPALEELMDKLQQYYAFHTVPLQSGDSCCVAKSPVDGKCYRGFITQRQKGFARVMLIDIGVTIQVREESLQGMKPEYSYLEGQAFRCSLCNLIEPADLKNCGEWSSQACQSLKDFVCDTTGGLRCKVVSQLNVTNKGLCNVVDLYNSQTQQSITHVLLELGLARETTASAKQLSTVFPESFVYSSYDIRPGNEERVFVTHVGSQHQVYCHLERNTEIIEKLEKKISEEIENMMQASTRAVVRKLCLAKYFDGKWYRGLAYPVKSPLHLSVFFVDYGNTSILEKTQVMFIPRDSTDLLSTPMQAVRCSLASVSKQEMYADVKDWLDGAILNKQVTAVILGKSEDGSFDVELFDEGVNVNEKVKALILSLLPKPKNVVTSDSSLSNSKCTNVSVNCINPPYGWSSYCPTSRPFTGKVWRAPPQNKHTKNAFYYKAQSKHTQLQQLNVDKTKCVPNVPVKQQKHCQAKQRREHRDTNLKSKPHYHTSETELPQLSCLPDKQVNAGFRAKCFISYIDSVNSFFLQLSEDEPALLKMDEDLNSVFLRDSLKISSTLRVGDLVLAEYEKDGALYRSVVKDYEGSSRFIVEFIDYGNSAAVGKEKIYSVPKDYLSQPRFSLSCFLLDTGAYENDASFTDAVMDKPLMVDFVRQHGTRWEVKVEILGGTVSLPAPHEAAVERSLANEKEEEPPARSPEKEEKATSCDHNYPDTEASKNDTTESETMMPRVLKPPPGTPSTKLMVKTCRYHKRTRTSIKRESKTNLKKASKSSTKVMRLRADAFTFPSIVAKDTEIGTVLSIQSNSTFYIRLAKTTDVFAALEGHIADNINKCEMVARDDIKQGLDCLAEVDNKMHRATVQQTVRGKCLVLLVDLGITAEISSSSLRKQCSSMNAIPNLAVLCKMKSEGEKTLKLWEQMFKSVIGKEVKLLFVDYSEAENIWMVELVINELFLGYKIATSLEQNKGIIPLPLERQYEATDGEPHKETSPPQQLDFAPIDMDKSYIGFAAAVTTPFEFCVVLEDLFLIMNKVSIMLDELPRLMPPLPEAHLVPGTCCLLKSESKNKWCRAEIINAEAALVLNLVDYGHCECLPYRDHAKLKRLPQELIKLPKVTYPCILRGVKAVGEDEQWTDEAAVFFQRTLYQRNLQIFFREFVSNTHWKVDILADGVHVAKELVDAGHANYLDIMLGLRFQVQTPHKAPLQHLDNEEAFGQKDEGSDEKSNLLAVEAEGKRLLSAVPTSTQCLLM
ncbi:tudor domain-containing protein 15 [Channa argus]|uniref:tudor domain-containing protein 15 n=1 Tax=Channa argus TaxID=215402 RepID=UPI00352025EF